MSTRFIINPVAERDIEDATDWYEQQRTGGSQRFQAELGQAFDRIIEAAGTHERVVGDFQRVLLRRVPYAVYYRLVGDVAVVMSVLHCSRDSAELDRRLAD